jgi:hypothetical protein
MNHPGGSRNGRDRGSSLFSYIRAWCHDLGSSTHSVLADRLVDFVDPVGSAPCGSTMKAGARQGEAETAEHATAATEAVLALAQKVHDAYVTEGQEARERLISQGQSRHDQVVGEATSRQQRGGYAPNPRTEPAHRPRNRPPHREPHLEP